MLKNNIKVIVNNTKDDAISLEARHQAILDLLSEKGSCSYRELSEAFNVSVMTVRRDAEVLSAAGRVIKTLGGLQAANGPSSLYETDVRSRLTENIREKRSIARAALELITPNSTLFLDGSTTCLELARAMVTLDEPVTVVTNSMLIALELHQARCVTVIMIGGELDRRSASCVGLDTERSLERFYVDQVFISTKGLVVEEGTFESSMANMRIKQYVAQNSRRVVLLVDHSKFGQRALRKVLDMPQIHTVITDTGASPQALAVLQKAGIETHIAETYASKSEGASDAS